MKCILCRFCKIHISNSQLNAQTIKYNKSYKNRCSHSNTFEWNKHIFRHRGGTMTHTHTNSNTIKIFFIWIFELPQLPLVVSALPALSYVPPLVCLPFDAYLQESSTLGIFSALTPVILHLPWYFYTLLLVSLTVTNCPWQRVSVTFNHS